MKYKDWCLEFYKKEYSTWKGKVAEGEEDNIVNNVSQRLLSRLNCIMGKNYGKRRFLPMRYLIVTDYSSYEEGIKNRKEKLKEFVKKRKRINEDIDNLTKRINDYNSNDKYTRDKLQEKLEQKKTAKSNINRKINKEIYDLENPKAEVQDYEQYYEEKRFDDLLEEEGAFFEYILKNISEGQLKEIEKNRWEKLDKKFREVVISVLEILQGVEEWDISPVEFERIKFKLRYPRAYRLYLIEAMIDEDGIEGCLEYLKPMQEDKMNEEKSTAVVEYDLAVKNVEKAIRKTQEKIDKIYKIIFSDSDKIDEEIKLTNEEIKLTDKEIDLTDEEIELIGADGVLVKRELKEGELVKILDKIDPEIVKSILNSLEENNEEE